MGLNVPGRPADRLTLRRAVWALLLVCAGPAAADPPALSEAERGWLQAHGEPVRVGVVETPPLVMRNDSAEGYHGLAIQFLRLYEQRLGWRSRIVLYPDLKTLLAAARVHEVDALLTAVNTPERRNFLNFPAPYVTLKNVIIGRQGEVSGPLDLARLAGQRVAVLDASAVHERIVREYPEVRPLPLRDERSLLSSVGLQEADFAITELSRAIWWIQHEKLATLRVVGETPFDYPLSLAVRSDWPEFASALDKTGRAFTEDEKSAILRRWAHLDSGAWLGEELVRSNAPWIAAVLLASFGGLLGAVLLLRGRVRRQTDALYRKLEQEEEMRARLENSERKFRQLAELTSDLFWETNDKLVFVRCYGGAEAQLPCDDATLLGKAWWDLPLQGMARQDLDALCERMTGREAFRRWVARWRDADGQPHWLSISGQPVYDERSNFVGYRGTGQDITQRMLQQQQLTESIQRLQAVQDGTLSFFGLLTPNGVLVDCNRAAYDFVGLDKSELVGRPFCELPWWRVEDEAARLHEAIASVRAGEFVRYDARIVDAAGAVHWIDFSLSPFYDEVGKLIYLVPEGRDITEAKRSSTALDNLLSVTGAAYGEVFFRKLVESMGRLLAVRYVFVGRLLPDGRRVRTLAVWSGGCFADNLEYELQHTPCEHVMDAACCVYPRNVQALFPNDVLLQEMGVESYMGVPIFSSTGQATGLLVVLHDRPLVEVASARRLMELFAVRAGTEMDRMAYEAEIRELNASLEARVAERTEALQQVNRELEAFSYSVSHDLRAPLRHVAGFVEMLAEDAQSTLSPEGRRFVRIIGEAAGRMGVMIDDLLALSRAGRAELRWAAVDLDRLAAEVVAHVRHGLGERRVEFRVGPLPRVHADRGLLTLVFENLVGNAVKYSRERDPAVVTIELALASNEREHVFVVSDNGVGFDMKYVGKLFGVFQRLHSESEYEGTGIGLANVRRIVERHGGRVWAEAEPGRGAAFYFTLPGHGAAAGPQALAA